MSKYIIDRDAASEFDDPAWLDDLWSTAIKKFGGKPISDVRDETPSEELSADPNDELTFIRYNLPFFQSFVDLSGDLAKLTHKTADEWKQFLSDAILKEYAND